MELLLDYSLGKNYHSKSQQMRVITEAWGANNLYCPLCGNQHIGHYKPNRPVADFYCENCDVDFELKSQNSAKTPSIINDGAYATMMERLASSRNPHFYLLLHQEQKITDLIFLPNYLITKECVQKRGVLSATARRHGWVGCNILLNQVVRCGQIYVVKDGVAVPPQDVIARCQTTEPLRDSSLKYRGWLLDVFQILQEIPQETFTLEDVYAFESFLSRRHSENRHVQAKIRQQLQLLRNRGVIEFSGNGVYRKINYISTEKI